MKRISIALLSLLFALALTVSPALASDPQDGPDHHGDEAGNNDVIMNSNEACVVNDVTAVAKTGDNYAGGSYAGDGGSGGSITASGDGEVEEASTGAGGTGGNAGIGGTVITGDASANASVMNLVNSNLTEVDRCACQPSQEVQLAQIDEEDGECCGRGEEGNNVMVMNRNGAHLLNEVKAIADTGDNRAKGSYAGDGGSGGGITAAGENAEVEEVGTGAGGNGGSSVDGGYVLTGVASSESSVINVVNRNLTRILR